MIWGVLFKDWNVFYIMLLYWAENVIIGVFNVIRMASAKNGGWLKLFLIPFFCFHYGMFCFVHGVFVIVLFGGALFASSNITMESIINGGILHYIFYIVPGIGWALLFFIVINTITLVKDYFNNGEYLQADIGMLMTEPYGRIIQLHIALMAGGFLIIITSSAKIVVCILVLLKMLLDLNYSLNAKNKRAAANMTQLS
jgi:hypothetical protein